MRLFVSVGVAGLEPATSSTRTKRATRLRHTPNEVNYTPGRAKLQVADWNNGTRINPDLGGQTGILFEKLPVKVRVEIGNIRAPLHPGSSPGRSPVVPDTYVV